MDILRDIASLRAWRAAQNQETIAFVPTMGALHRGHLTLVEKAKVHGTRVIMSIYVNPLQFGPHEDLERYPRPLEDDLRLAEAAGVHAVFVPDSEALHPQGLAHLTHVVPPPALVNQLCGLSRPGHFTGVATIVAKLFNLVQPHVAVFGEKDAQQLAIIRQMVADLDMPIRIVPASTVREADGLAVSSRNTYLVTDEQRREARLVSRLLTAVQTLYRQGVETTEEALSLAQESVLDPALYPDFSLEYLAAVDAETFLPVETLDDRTRFLVAARIGHVRLIDNALVSEPIILAPDKGFLEARPV